MKLSVIVCTRNRGYAIKACLSSVASALKNIEPVKSEIVVVNNASEDDTENIIKNWTETNSTPLNLIYEPRKGLAVARNCGLRHAKGELLAFTDDDCRLAPDYAINILRYDRDDREPVLRGGRVELGDSSDLPFSIRPGLKTERWQKDRYAANLGTLGTSIIGASMIMQRKLAEQVGLFDERFGAGSYFNGGEEVDYIYRTYLKGFLVEFCPDLLVHHFHGRKTQKSARSLVLSYDFADGALCAKFLFKNPQLLRQLYWDFRKSIFEILGGPLSRPELNISHRTRIATVMKGMGFYYILALKEKLKFFRAK